MTVSSVLYKKIDKLREIFSEYAITNDTDSLSAYAILDKNSQKYNVKIKVELSHSIYILQTQRDTVARPLSLNAAANCIHDIGFTTFTVLMVGDI